jgi:hypothetical protein
MRYSVRMRYGARGNLCCQTTPQPCTPQTCTQLSSHSCRQKLGITCQWQCAPPEHMNTATTGLRWSLGSAAHITSLGSHSHDQHTPAHPGTPQHNTASHSHCTPQPSTAQHRSATDVMTATTSLDVCILGSAAHITSLGTTEQHSPFVYAPPPLTSCCP